MQKKDAERFTGRKTKRMGQARWNWYAVPLATIQTFSVQH